VLELTGEEVMTCAFAPAADSSGFNTAPTAKASAQRTIPVKFVFMANLSFFITKSLRSRETSLQMSRSSMIG